MMNTSCLSPDTLVFLCVSGGRSFGRPNFKKKGKKKHLELKRWEWVGGDLVIRPGILMSLNFTSLASSL